MPAARARGSLRSGLRGVARTHCGVERSPDGGLRRVTDWSPSESRGAGQTWVHALPGDLDRSRRTGQRSDTASGVANADLRPALRPLTPLLYARGEWRGRAGDRGSAPQRLPASPRRLRGHVFGAPSREPEIFGDQPTGGWLQAEAVIATRSRRERTQAVVRQAMTTRSRNPDSTPEHRAQVRAVPADLCEPDSSGEHGGAQQERQVDPTVASMKLATGSAARRRIESRGTASTRARSPHRTAGPALTPREADHLHRGRLARRRAVADLAALVQAPTPDRAVGPERATVITTDRDARGGVERCDLFGCGGVEDRSG